MKHPISKFTLTACLIAAGGMNPPAGATGTWTPVVANAPGQSGGLMILMSDGTILCKSYPGGSHGGYGNTWMKLTPDSSGSYANGTWSPNGTIANMADTRYYFSSQLLQDGRLYVCGGEYGTGADKGEVYDPIANAWTPTPAPGAVVSDACSEILPDGRVMQSLVSGNLRSTLIWNPATNAFITGPTCTGIHNEALWAKLPDNSILMVNRLSTQSERWIAATNAWANDAVVPVQLYDSFGDECGGGALLPNGKMFFAGSPGTTAIYTPTGSAAIGSWVAGPPFPGGNGAPDAPLAMMSDGKVLLAACPVPTATSIFTPPTSFYEYDYVTNSMTQVNAPTGGLTLGGASYIYTMLDLPDGNVMFSTQNSNKFYIYKPGGPPLAAGKPTITDLAQNNCGDYTLTGRLFNGISEGASYGDDWQMNTNYPIVRLTGGSTVYYARTFNWSHTGVAMGATVNTTRFTVPANVPAGTYSLVVTANGIASDPIVFDYAPTRSADLNGDGVVDSADMGLLLLDFGPCAGCASDLDEDGVVDSSDIGLVLLGYGPCQ